MRKIRVLKKSNEILNRLNKTKKESHPDFRAEREKRDREERKKKERINDSGKIRNNVKKTSRYLLYILLI